MFEKTIKKVLNNKFESFLKSIPEEEIKTVLKENTIITGGCIASMLLNEKVNDFDLYFRTKEVALKVAQYFVQLYQDEVKNKADVNNVGISTPIDVKEEDGRISIFIRSSGVDSITSEDEDYRYFETLDPGSPEQENFIDNAVTMVKSLDARKKNSYMPVFLTSNAITLSDQIQLIIRFYGEPEEIHKNYDFVHCTNFWTSWNKELVLQADALKALLTKELKYQGSLYPIASLIRMRKFVKRGWFPTAGTFLKIAYQINDLDLKNPEILREQLLGVDVAYFRDLLNRIQNKSDIDSIYICSLIDEIEGE